MQNGARRKTSRMHQVKSCSTKLIRSTCQSQACSKSWTRASKASWSWAPENGPRWSASYHARHLRRIRTSPRSSMRCPRLRMDVEGVVRRVETQSKTLSAKKTQQQTHSSQTCSMLKAFDASPSKRRWKTFPHRAGPWFILG